ncbi:MAG: TetR/AcrR family transcriptional regulator [Woeseiaceae bacterium]|nr:TetR/AcrR family transcriptional regulator [Woeseiaceae bacterium]
MSRSPAYNRQTVIDQAMAVFWERGYGQTSVGDLVRATGLKPGSLYAAFGSKKGVFLEVLDEYNRQFLARVRSLTRGNDRAIRNLKSLLEDIIEETVAGRDRRGCLSVNAMLELSRHEPDVAARLVSHSESVRGAFAEVLDVARDQGDIAESKDTAALSAFLVNNIWGLRVMCKGSPNRRTMQAVVDGIMAGLTSD